MDEKFVTFTDAQTFVVNSGVFGWDWGDERDDMETLDLLADFIYHYADEYDDFDDLLIVFIRDVLNDDPDLYSIGK